MLSMDVIGSEIGEERGVRCGAGLEDEIDFDIGISIQAALVVDVEAVQHAVRELVIAGPVIGVLEALNAHAHHKIVRLALSHNFGKYRSH